VSLAASQREVRDLLRLSACVKVRHCTATRDRFQQRPPHPNNSSYNHTVLSVLTTSIITNTPINVQAELTTELPALVCVTCWPVDVSNTSTTLELVPALDAVEYEAEDDDE